MKRWRWPVRVYVEAETQQQAMDIIVEAMNDAFGEDGWRTSQAAEED